MATYVVKFGDEYSTGGFGDGPLEHSGHSLKLSRDRKEAFRFADREFAHKHALVWTDEAILKNVAIPRVVKLKDQS